MHDKYWEGERSQERRKEGEKNERKGMKNIERGKNEIGKKEGNREKWELMKRNAWEKLRKGKMRQERRKEVEKNES